MEKSLDGVWRFRLDPGETGGAAGYSQPGYVDQDWEFVEVPSQWQLQGHRYYTGTAWYRTSFEIPNEMIGRTVRLRLNGVDYFADVWLDGEHLGTHEGYFNRFEFEIPSTPGRKVLAVRVNAPAPRHDWKQKNIAKGTLHAFDCKGDPNLFTGGIWRSVELVATGACYVGCVQVAGLPCPEREARAELRVAVRNASSSPVSAQLRIRIGPSNFEGGRGSSHTEQVVLQPGDNQLELQYGMPEPRLWWTWDMGEQNLYRCEVEVVVDGEPSDTWSGTFGIREITGGPDQDWALYLNGKRLFLRGTVYISNLYMTLMDDASYAKDVALMRGANMNGALVLSNVEKEGFYDQCDREGLLLFQVFPLVWGSYECSAEFADRCKPMMADMMAMLYNHPSICIVACASEPDLDGLEAIVRPVYEAVKHLDNTRIVIDGSSVGGFAVYSPEEAERYRRLCYNSDNHFYDAHFGAGIRDTEKRDPLLVTEFGDIGVPNLESLRRFLPDHAIWPPNWEVWRPLFNGSVANMTWPIVHQHRLTWLAVRVEERLNVLPGSPEEFVEITQKWQAFVNKYTIESYRLRKYAHCNGLTNYHFVDMQPAITTALLDYYRVPKLAYYAVADAYRPLHVVMRWPAERYEAGWLLSRALYVINDYHREFPGCAVTWVLRDPGGLEACRESVPVEIAEDSLMPVGAVEWAFPRDAVRGTYTVNLRLTDAEGQELSHNSYDVSVV